jgi:hypothetical protein
MKSWINLRLTLVIAAVPGMAQTDNGSHAAAKPMGELEKTVIRDSSFVKHKYPAAKLFQVAIFGLVPRALTDEKEIDSVIQSWYDIGSEGRYVQAIQTRLRSAVAAPEVTEMSFQAEPCKKGYPLPGSRVCTSETGVAEGPRTALPIGSLSELVHLSDWIVKAGLDPSDRYDVTITTAAQLDATVMSPQSSSNSEVFSALVLMKPEQLVLSVTDRSGSDQSKTGTTIFLDGSTGEVVGRSRIVKQHLLPSRRP